MGVYHGGRGQSLGRGARITYVQDFSCNNLALFHNLTAESLKGRILAWGLRNSSSRNCRRRSLISCSRNIEKSGSISRITPSLLHEITFVAATRPARMTF